MSKGAGLCFPRTQSRMPRVGQRETCGHPTLQDFTEQSQVLLPSPSWLQSFLSQPPHPVDPSSLHQAPHDFPLGRQSSPRCHRASADHYPPRPEGNQDSAESFRPTPPQTLPLGLAATFPFWSEPSMKDADAVHSSTRGPSPVWSGSTGLTIMKTKC